jgi:signal recognition particle subunit SRP54
MGDVLSLIEKAEREVEPADAEELQRKIRRAEFTLEDFLGQMKQVRKMGPLTSILGMMPGMGKTMRDLGNPELDEGELDRVEAIILSMTPDERAHPDRIDGSRRKRIARGAGVNVPAVKQLVGQFDETRRMLQLVAKGEMPSADQLLKGRAPKQRIRYR